MKRYLAELLILLVGVLLILVAPDVALSAEVIGIPIVLALAGASVLYLWRVLRQQPEPRSRFFRMLVGISARATLLGLWVGYLVIGRIGDRTGWYFIPTPSPAVSSPISGLIVMVWIAPPVVYALTVWRVRRAATRAPYSTAAEDTRELDRET